MSKPAVVLLSGGLDSTTVLALAASAGYQPFALSFRYGQRHSIELDAARRVVAEWEVKRHVVADIDLRAFGGSALTSDVDVPKHDSAADLAADLNDEGVPITYVPARNTIFLSFALAYAETVEAVDVFIGVNALDYSGYPDCRPEYIAAFENMANLATRSGINGARTTIHTPLISMSKAEIIRTGMDLGVDYSMTWSCYDPSVGSTARGPVPAACGRCDSCLLRLKGFSEVGVEDPAPYWIA